MRVNSRPAAPTTTSDRGEDEQVVAATAAATPPTVERGPAERGSAGRELVAVDHAQHGLDHQHQAERDDHRVERRARGRRSASRPRSTTAPSSSPPTSAATKPSQYEPVAVGDAVGDVRGATAIAPWAKLTIRAARQISTRASANAA